MKKLEKLNCDLFQNIEKKELSKLVAGSNRTMTVCTTSTNDPQYNCGDTSTTTSYDGSWSHVQPSTKVEPNLCV